AMKAAYPSPAWQQPEQWPPTQAEYLRVYLKESGCKTVVVEQHYIDRVFMHDDAVFYVRNLRSYPNFTKRLHFFTEEFDQNQWKLMIACAGNGRHAEIEARLQQHYCGFSVVRPLPDSPVGRTLLPARAIGV